jgi:hypothetical protein
MIWFQTDLERLGAEKTAIAKIEEDCDWLSDVDWRISADCHLFVNFMIDVGEARYLLRMTYPRLFPAIPPDISPQMSGQRLSRHQYKGGRVSVCNGAMIIGSRIFLARK